MDLSKWLNDERLLANLIGIHVVLAAILVVSILLRKMFKNGGEQLVRWTGLAWLDGASREAVKGVRSILFWSTIALMIQRSKARRDWLREAHACPTRQPPMADCRARQVPKLRFVALRAPFGVVPLLARGLPRRLDRCGLAPRLALPARTVLVPPVAGHLAAHALQLPVRQRPYHAQPPALSLRK